MIKRTKYNIGDKIEKLRIKDMWMDQRGVSLSNRIKCLCLCDCGKEISIWLDYMYDPKAKKCDCNAKLHYLSNHTLYSIFSGMKTRCYNKNSVDYHNYGGRGITICDEWIEDFRTFYDWSLNNGWEDGLTIDRINNNGNYEPLNCRWITQKAQCNNTRKTIMLEAFSERKSLSEWSEDYRCKVNYATLAKRYHKRKLHHTNEYIISNPARKLNKKSKGKRNDEVT